MLGKYCVSEAMQAPTYPSLKYGQLMDPSSVLKTALRLPLTIVQSSLVYGSGLLLTEGAGAYMDRTLVPYVFKDMGYLLLIAISFLYGVDTVWNTKTLSQHKN
jgi:hypothetical protein